MIYTGWSEDLGPPRRGKHLAFLIRKEDVKELSIFIDESGDFGKFDNNCPYYIVSLLLHEQSECIKSAVQYLDNVLTEMGFNNHTVHTGPLIRREGQYKTEDINVRYKLFNKIFSFTRNAPVKYKTLIVDKKYTDNAFIKINQSLSKQLGEFIRENLQYFNNFDRIIVYYDNGQIQLTNIIISVFSTFFNDEFVEYRAAYPEQYRLYQSADLICTLTLLDCKINNNISFTKSELKFFGSVRKLKKNYLKFINKLKF